jgi:hypothetical protein
MPRDMLMPPSNAIWKPRVVGCLGYGAMVVTTGVSHLTSWGACHQNDHNHHTNYHSRLFHSIQCNGRQ